MKWFDSKMGGATRIIVAAMFALGMFAPAHSAAAIRVIVDDVPLALIPPATVSDEILYLPLRPIAQHFQAGLKFDNRVIELQRADGTVFILRLDRLEIWSGGIVVAVLEAPVRLVNGVTMIPRGAVDVLFDALTVWDRQEQLVTIVTRKTFQATVTSKPLPPPQVTPPASARAFAAEFQPETERPLLASGYVTLGLALGGSGATTSTGLQFRSYGGQERIEGAMTLTAGSGAFQAAGTVTIRRPSSTLTLGNLSVQDSPLTLFEQGLVGGLYQRPVGRYDTRLIGGALSNSSVQVYGLNVALPSVEPWLLGGGLLYGPGDGTMILKIRAERPFHPGLVGFGEIAGGVSATGAGTAWRVGATVSAPNLSTSISYLSLSPGFPTIGNASLFAGRSGPLLQLSYRPGPQWSVVGSAALLSGRESGVPDRTAYSLLLGYRHTPTFGIVAEVRSIEDTASGVRMRNTLTQAAATYTSGRWGFVLAGNHIADANLLTGITAGASILSLRAGYALGGGLPLWAEVARSEGSIEGWRYGLGWSFRLSPQIDLTTQLRHGIFSYPIPYTESALELGVSRPLHTGAHLTVGAGVRYNSAGTTTPYLAMQYGYPVYVHGTVRVGRLVGVVFQDTNGNGLRDPGEPAVAGVVMRIDDHAAALSDVDGTLAVDRVPEGEYQVSLDENTIPASLLIAQKQQIVRVADNDTTTLEFALAPAASLRGVLYLDENDNGVRDSEEKGIGGVIVTLQPLERMWTSEVDGTFEFLHLPAGEYVLAVDPRSLPQGVRLKGEGTYVVTLRPGASAVIEIPLLGKPIVKTFTAP